MSSWVGLIFDVNTKRAPLMLQSTVYGIHGTKLVAFWKLIGSDRRKRGSRGLKEVQSAQQRYKEKRNPMTRIWIAREHPEEDLNRCRRIENKKNRRAWIEYKQRPGLSG